MSAPPINNSDGINGSRLREQYFFGPDFNAIFQTSAYQQQQQQSSSQFLNSGSGGSSALLGAGGCNGGSGLNVKTPNSTDSFLFDNLGEEFDTFLNLRSPILQPPQSAPPFSLSMGSSFAFPGNYGMLSPYQSNYNNTAGRGRFARQHQKVPQPEYYSLKVFLGGIPANITTNILQLNFAKFGKSFIDWPKKTVIQDRPANGYAFVVFEKEQSVIQMLSQCKHSNDRVFYPVYTLNGLMHPVEVKVWQMVNTIYAAQENWRKFRRFSVFVGGIPRIWTAQMLTMAVEEVIGKVVYCAIELDQDHFYPKGAACIVFQHKEAYIKAIAAHKVALNFVTCERQVEFKPFLASNMPCEKCGMTSGTRFCSEMICLAYFCQDCWKQVHLRPSMSTHQPSKRQQPIGSEARALQIRG